MVCWYLCKNLSNFVYPVWKLHNPYCHNETDLYVDCRIIWRCCLKIQNFMLFRWSCVCSLYLLCKCFFFQQIQYEFRSEFSKNSDAVWLFYRNADWKSFELIFQLFQLEIKIWGNLLFPSFLPFLRSSADRMIKTVGMKTIWSFQRTVDSGTNWQFKSIKLSWVV